MDLKEFGLYFSKLREKSGYRSQRELADKSGVSHSTINRIEAGTHKASTETLKTLSNYLKEVTYEDLMVAAGYWEENSANETKNQDFDSLLPPNLSDEDRAIIMKYLTDPNLNLAFKEFAKAPQEHIMDLLKIHRALYGDKKN